MRLQVFLSHNGVCSRRQAMDLIKKGDVTVNGKIVREPSTEIDQKKDKVAVDGTGVKVKPFRYVMLNKPKGYVTSKSDKFASKIVLELLPSNLQHLSPVGRLDRDSEGLLLLTNDGDFAYKLTHPKFNLEKVYCVRVLGRLELKERQKIEKGVYLDGKKTSPSKIKILKVSRNQTDCQITIHEGRKRQVRRMFAKVKHRVVYLKRIQQGPVKLGSLKTGQWRDLGGTAGRLLLNL